MMKTLLTKNSLLKSKRAVTFVELMVCIIVASLVFKVVYDFMTNTRWNYMYGSVNLQNLQEAILAINYLRRDFASACPKFKDPNDDKNSGFLNLQKVRKQLFITKNSEKELEDGLIQVYTEGLMFNKFLYGSFGTEPKIEAISYQFNPTTKTLIRTSNIKGTHEFKGFEDVNFALYTHSINKDVPVLWVKFRIHDNEYGKKDIGKPLELTTTISSSFINSSINNKYWRYQTGHSY